MNNSALSQLSILLVEPSATQLKIILQQFELAGIQSIDGATSGEEALDFINKYPPDLVVSAMYLPDMTATDLLTTIRNEPDTQTTNFMLISSETHFNALNPIRQAGVVAILPKPFAFEDLTRALHATLDYITPEEIEISGYEVDEIQVLLVDDSSMARKHITRVLEGLGIVNIKTAVNGAEAADILAVEDYDLVITDLNMPEMDGQQLIEFIRNDLGNDTLPIVIVTSENDEARLDNIQHSGVSAILDKPFEPKIVRDLLHHIMS
jgi:two-component system chemotaxis response regulator CheY